MNARDQKNHLRIQLRQQRSHLSPSFCQHAAEQLAQQSAQLSLLKAAKHLAYYWPCQNEIDPRPLIQKMTACTHYLPVLTTHKILQFYPYKMGDAITFNQYKIPEPITEQKSLIATEELDVVLVPLLGFDLEGHRLGMGGGYYDQSFEFLNRQAPSKPILIGLAYEFQKVDSIPSESFDVKLNFVLTESSLYSF